MAQYLFVVAQDKPDLCDYLRGWFSGVPTVQVMLDRRQGAGEPGQRQAERRVRKDIDVEIRQTGFAIVGIASP